jgi:hypothetical protein
VSCDIPSPFAVSSNHPSSTNVGLEPRKSVSFNIRDPPHSSLIISSSRQGKKIIEHWESDGSYDTRERSKESMQSKKRLAREKEEWDVL